MLLKQGLDNQATTILDNYLEDHPEDHELITPLYERGTDDSSTTPTLPSVSVIVPTHDCAATILDTLTSITAALALSRLVYPTTGEIIVIDDLSTDNTTEIVRQYATGCEVPLRLCQNPTNLGAGPSRNLGVRQATGNLIFFLDGDDIFFPEHIFLCLHQLIYRPEIHFVKTGIRIDEEIHPYWKNAISNSVPFNICLRRWCHELIGGFPEGETFTALRCEDAVYRSLLSRYFLGATIKRETLQHFRYPGNALDRQMEKFSRPPGEVPQEECMSPAELAALPRVQKVMEKKRHNLETNLAKWLEKLQTNKILSR
jgi:glycosyltransferase involved in cell wall biosynthesis